MLTKQILKIIEVVEMIEKSKANEIPTEYKYLNNLTSQIKTQPFHGQIEMMAVANTYNSNINTLKDSLKVITKTNEIDDLKRLVKTSVNNNGQVVLSNNITYNASSTKVTKEVIKKGSSQTNLTTRTYTYGNTNYKYNVIDVPLSFVKNPLSL